MTVLISDPFQQIQDPDVRQLGFAELLAAADFVVCLAPATESTENLMNGDAFARMRRDAFFINLSRGNLVDEAALEHALDDGHIAGAAMDVGRDTDQKPSPRLAGRPDVLATPHIGGLTLKAAEHQAFDTVKQVANCSPAASRPAPSMRKQRIGYAVSALSRHEFSDRVGMRHSVTEHHFVTRLVAHIPHRDLRIVRRVALVRRQHHHDRSPSWSGYTGR